MNGNVLVSAIFVLSTASANVMQKKAMALLGPVRGISLDLVRRLLLSPYLWAGMGSYVLALAMYLVLLSRVPLNRIAVPVQATDASAMARHRGE